MISLPEYKKPASLFSMADKVLKALEQGNTKYGSQQEQEIFVLSAEETFESTAQAAALADYLNTLAIYLSEDSERPDIIFAPTSKEGISDAFTTEQMNNSVIALSKASDDARQITAKRLQQENAFHKKQLLTNKEWTFIPTKFSKFVHSHMQTKADFVTAIETQQFRDRLTDMIDALRAFHGHDKLEVEDQPIAINLTPDDPKDKHPTIWIKKIVLEHCKHLENPKRKQGPPSL